MRQPVFIVIVNDGYNGEDVGGVFFELEEALHAVRRLRGYRVEEWLGEQFIGHYTP